MLKPVSLVVGEEDAASGNIAECINSKEHIIKSSVSIDTCKAHS